jgi:hypothetical protein
MYTVPLGMRPDRIVMAPPAFDDDLSFSEGVEDLAMEQLVAKAGVEALNIAVFPRTAPLDVGSLSADSGDPSLAASATNSGPLSDRM